MDARVVVDASVWVSWLSGPDVHHSASYTWVDQYTGRDGLLVLPAFLLIEVAAAISRLTRETARAKEAISKLHAISTIEIVPFDAALTQAAIDVASDLQLRAGDAIYVALAQQRNIPLVSWDKEQLQKAGSVIKTYTPSEFAF